MKTKELRALSNEELRKKLVDLKKDLIRGMTKRLQKSSTEKTAAIKKIRREIAKIITILKEKGGR
ncbi:50S ribosomal protein L29 [Candidatus Woesearchaeota archaeon]|nr:50S ribosomal protein L29 [Candidatus Woesearchaeota archaeon]RLE40881.1 MAG: 50S ribosomal protein L29 [Candidatus Woesearchaeota archaeon]